MDSLKLILTVIGKHTSKSVYIFTAIALAELIYLYVLAMSDGNIDQKEATALKASATRVVESLS